MAKPIEEKRRYLRLNKELEVEFTIPNSHKVCTATTKDLSALGLRFITKEKLQEGTAIEVKLKLPNAQSAVHALGCVAWAKKLSLEDNAESDIGVEFTKIEEDNKNTFLKYLCDLIYG